MKKMTKKLVALLLCIAIFINAVACKNAPVGLSFTFTGEKNGKITRIYNGETQTVDVAANAEGKEVAFTVGYYKGGNLLDEDNLPKNAGTYKVKAEAAEKGYTGSREIELIIEKAELTVIPKVDSAANKFIVTQSSAEAGSFLPGYTLEGMLDGTDGSGINVSFTYAGPLDKTVFSASKPSVPGDYKVKFTVDDQNYSGEAVADISVTLNINIVQIVLPGRIYGDLSVHPDAYINDFNALSSYIGQVVTRYTGRNGTVYDSASAPENAGHYTVAFTLSVKGSDMAETFVRDFDITPQSLGLSIGSNRTFTIGGDVNHPITSNVFSGQTLLNALNITYTKSGSSASSQEVPTEAGTYNVTFSPKSPNYQATASLQSLTVAYTFNARPTSGIGFDSLTRTYNGQPQTVCLTGLEAWHSQTGDILYTGINDTEYTENAAAPTNAGEYQVSVNVAVDGTQVPFTGKLTIQRKTVVFTADGKTFLTGESINHDFTFEAAAEASLASKIKVVYYLNEEPVTGVPTEAGKYKVAFEIDEDNYCGGYETDYIISDLDEITASASKTYDGEAAVLTVSGLDNDYQSVGDISYAGRDGTVYDSPDAPVNAGKYKAVIEIFIAGRDGVEILEFEFEIFQRTLNVAAGDQLLKTGEAFGHDLTYNDSVLSGEGGILSIVTVSYYDGETLLGGAPAADGVYRVVFTCADPNYKFAAAVEAVYTFADNISLEFKNTSITYGDARRIELNYVEGYHEITIFTCTSQKTGTVYNILNGEYPLNADTYDIHAEILANGEITETRDGTLVINKKQITVTFAPAVFELGGPIEYALSYSDAPGFIPAYSVSYSGVAEGAPAAAGTYTASFTFGEHQNHVFTAAGTVAVGFYAAGLPNITFTGSAAVSGVNNSAVTLNPETGVFEVQYTINSGGTAQGRGVTAANSLGNNQFIMFVGSNGNVNNTAVIRFTGIEGTSYSSSTTLPSAPGKYQIDVVARVRNITGSSGNGTAYTDITLTRYLTIYPRAVTVTAEDKAFNVGATVSHTVSNNHQYPTRVTYTDPTYQKLNSENNPEGEVSPTVPALAGRYLVTFIYSSNYAVTGNTAVYTFNARSGNVAFGGLEQLYGRNTNATVTLQAYHTFVSAELTENGFDVPLTADEQGRVITIIPAGELQAGEYELKVKVITDGVEEIVVRTIAVAQDEVQLAAAESYFTLADSIPADKEQLRPKVSGLGSYDFTVMYQKGDIVEGAFVPDGSGQTSVTPVAVGDYLVTFTLAERNFAGSVSAVYHIVSTRLGVAYFNSSYTLPYTGSPVSVTPNALDNYHLNRAWSYSGTTSAGASYGPSSAAPSELGTYTVMFTCVTDGVTETLNTALYIKVFVNTRLDNHIYQKGASETYATGTPVSLPAGSQGETVTYAFDGLAAGEAPSLPGEYTYTVTPSAYIHPSVTSGTVSVMFDRASEAFEYGRYYFENVATHYKSETSNGLATSTVLIVTNTQFMRTLRLKSDNGDFLFEVCNRQSGSPNGLTNPDTTFAIRMFSPHGQSEIEYRERFEGMTNLLSQPAYSGRNYTSKGLVLADSAWNSAWGAKENINWFVTEAGFNPKGLSMYGMAQQTITNYDTAQMTRPDGGYSFTFILNKYAVVAEADRTQGNGVPASNKGTFAQSGYVKQVTKYSKKTYNNFLSLSITYTLDKYGRIITLNINDKYGVDYTGNPEPNLTIQDNIDYDWGEGIQLSKDMNIDSIRTYY